MFKSIRKWFNKSDGLDDELAFHLEQLEQDRLSAGDAPAQARAAARKKLGNITIVRENVFDLSPIRLIDDVLRHIRFALRTFGQHGGTYGAAIGILALGIGMSVTIFSLVQAVILRPLPFPQQQSIEVIWKKDLRSGVALVEMAYPELRDLEANIKAFEYVAMMPPSLYGYGRVMQFLGGSRCKLKARR